MGKQEYQDVATLVGSSAFTANNKNNGDVEGKSSSTPASSPLSTMSGFLAYILTDIDPTHSTWPLATHCFVTGLLDAVSFTAIFVWCGFQTGNFCQLALAIARFLAHPPDHTFHIADRQALVSLISFNLGAFLIRLTPRPHARLWLAFGTLLQAVFLAAGALALWRGGDPSIAGNRGQPAWTSLRSYVCLAFMSASLGLQGIMSKKFNTHFGTTIVLTTVWCELMSDPFLFATRSAPSRDHKVLGALALFCGGFVGRALVDQIGSPGALGVGACVRVCIAIGWTLVPARAQ